MILVTGGTGFLGQRLVRKLVEWGHRDIRCLVRPGSAPDILRPILEGLPPANVEIFHASFNDLGALKRALAGVDIVYHAAASKSGSVPAMVANTVVGSENLYRACVETRISRCVLVSSFGVIGVAKLPRKAWVDEGVSMEDHPERRDPYSFSKHRQETVAWEYAKREGLPLVVVRPGVIFGRGGSVMSPRIGINLFGVFLHLGGRNQIPLTYVDNCAEAIALAGTVPGINGEVFCIVDDDLPVSRALLGRYRKEVAPLHVLRVPYPLLKVLAKWNVWYSNRTQGHLPTVFTPYEVESIWKNHRFSNRKAKERLGWRPRVPMKEALDRTFSALASAEEQKKGKEGPSA